MHSWLPQGAGSGAAPGAAESTSPPLAEQACSQKAHSPESTYRVGAILSAQVLVLRIQASGWAHLDFTFS